MRPVTTLTVALTIAAISNMALAEENVPEISFVGLDSDGFAQLTSGDETWSYTCDALEDEYNIAFEDLSHAFQESQMQRIRAHKHDPNVITRIENKKQIEAASAKAGCPAMVLTTS